MFDINNIKGYELEKKIYNKEFDINIYLLTHVKTKAKIVLMDNDDTNRCFNIAFRTPVNNSKGIPHILEHSVLCGSKKYDVKDPFIELVKGSLNTFLNAMTGNDVTFYPVASTNEKDFKNLVDVYLDSVFFPLCKENKKIFMQEGWHYEINEKTGELDVNGIVLNEMRGDLSSEDSIINYNILENLYKGTNFEYVSGGNPKEIINLSYKEFCDFHDKYYNPTNSIIYFYGALNMNEMLTYLDKEYLSKFDLREVAKYDKIKEFEKDHITRSFYNVEKKEDNQTHIAINYIIDYERSTVNRLIIRMIDYILFSCDSALIKERFIKEGLALDVDTYIEESLSKGYFSVVIKNTKEEYKDKIIKIFDEEIDKIINNGIDENKLESIINKSYFHLLEEEYKIPKGLEIIFNTLNTYIYDEDIDIYIKYIDEYEMIKKENYKGEHKKNNIFVDFVKALFKDNKYRGIGIIESKEKLVLDNEKELREKLNDINKKLTKEEIDIIIKEDKELKIYQNEKESDEKLKKIPKISVDDIDKVRNHYNYKVDRINNVDYVVTNDDLKGLCYIKLNFNITDLSDDAIYFAVVLSNLITYINLTDTSYEELESKIDKVSGGISAVINIAENDIMFSLSVKCLYENVDKNIEILNELLTKNDFIKNSTERIKNKIDSLNLEAKNSFMFKGHMAALNRSLSKINTRCKYYDMCMNCGIAYNLFLSDLVKEYKNNQDKVNLYLDNLYKKIINFDNAFVDILVDKENENDIKNKLSKLIEKNSNNKKVEIKKYDGLDFDKYMRTKNKEAFIVSGDVNFVSRAGIYDKKLYNGYLSVLSVILNREYLWNNIRVLGGAYGAFATILRDGTGAYVSYRDPNLVRSDEIYKNVVSYVDDLDFSKDKIDKFIIGTISILDTPLSKNSNHVRNVTSYIVNISNDEVDKIRTEILNTDLNKLKSCIKAIKEINDSDEITAIISSKNKEEAKNYYENLVTL